MADEADPQVSEQDTSVEQTTVDSQSETQTQDSDVGSTEQAGENQEGKTDAGNADQSASTGDKSKSENRDSQKDSKPLSRRSAAYRIQQLTQQLKEAKSQQRPVQQDEWEDTPAQDEPQPDIAELVAKEVERRLNPIVSESSKAADDAEINDLFSGDKAGERSRYEPAIREMWKLDQYKNVAAADLYKIASFDDAVSAAVSKAIEDYKQAQKEARDSSASGSNNTSNRTGKTGKPISEMTDEELLLHNERVKAGLA